MRNKLLFLALQMCIRDRCQMAPRPGQLKVTVWIDGEKVPVLMKQEIKEYFDSNEYGNAYLLTVDMPKHPKKDLPYRIFKVELEDMENGDRGEGLYFEDTVGKRCV